MKNDDFEIVYGGKSSWGKGGGTDASEAIDTKVLPLLNRIEQNTRNISGASRDIVAATRHTNGGGAVSSGSPALTPAKERTARQAQSAPVAARCNASKDIDRSSNGRFVQRSAVTAASAAKNADIQAQSKAAQNDAATRKGFLSSIRDLVGNNSMAGRVAGAVKGSDSADAAGAAAGGALWGAAKEAMDAFGDLKDTLSDSFGGMFGKGKKEDGGEEDSATVKTLQGNERAEEKRHTEILSALGKVSGGGGGGLVDDLMVCVHGC